MDKEEALAILRSRLREYRERSYDELTKLIGSQDTFEVPGPSGTKYQLEVQAFWDGGRPGDLRVLGSVDDGGWRAFSPLSEDFIMKSDGTFVGE